MKPEQEDGETRDAEGTAGDGGPERGPPEGQGSETVDRADYDPSYDPDAPVVCELCGEVMFYTAACKLKCPRCGYMRDCSDP